MDARSINSTLAALAVALCLGSTAWAAAGNKALEVPATAKGPLTKAAFEAGRKSIERQYDADRKACGRLKGQAKDVCQAQAKGRQEAETAKLEARYKPSPDKTQQAKEVTAQANFKVAKEKCETLKGDAKDKCIDLAKAAREAAVRQARVEKVDSTGGVFGKGAVDKAAPRLPNPS
jgi:hypothetical protein